MMRLFVTLLFFASTLSFASDWIPLGSSSSGEPFYLDESSVLQSGPSTWKAWAKVASSTAAKEPPKYSHYLLLYEVNCPDKTYRNTSKVEYSSDGKVLDQQTFQSSTFQPSIPDSVGEVVQQAICTQALLRKFTDWRNNNKQ